MEFIHYLEKISGVSIYPLISLLVFFLFFAVLFFLVLRMDKHALKELKNIPLDEQASTEKK